MPTHKELTILEKPQHNFIAEIKQKIHQAQYEAMKAVNVQLITLYWEIGKAIAEKQQESWGKAVVPTLSEELQKEFPGVSGFSVTNLWLMAQFYTEYHDVKNLQPLVGEISWSKHIVILNRCKDNLERQFYIQATKAIELKVGEFLPEYKGKMEFYLAVLNDKIKLPNENDAIGIIICKDKNRTVVEYSLKTSNMPIGIAIYTTTAKLPENYQKFLPDEKTITNKLTDWFDK